MPVTNRMTGTHAHITYPNIIIHGLDKTCVGSRERTPHPYALMRFGDLESDKEFFDSQTVFAHYSIVRLRIQASIY